ncbi:MAG: LysR family transcriptional regulator [Steroidobacteraceae bacterium]
MLNLNELALFAAVVKSGSLSGAARTLNLSKAAVSEQLRRLEERLGTRLLNRTTRKVSLTEAGEACFRHCERMLESAEAAANAAQALHVEPRGELRVSAPQTFAPMHIAPALPSFLAQYPALTIDLSVTPRLVNLVEEKIDVAIRIGALNDSTLVARRLAFARLIIVAAPDYLRRRGIPQTGKALAQHDVMQFSSFDWGDHWLLDDPKGTRQRLAVTARLRCDSGESLVAAARAGAGLAAVPNWMVQAELAAGTLVQVLHGWGRKAVPIHAVHSSGGLAAAKVRAFVTHLAQWFATAEWNR